VEGLADTLDGKQTVFRLFGGVSDKTATGFVTTTFFLLSIPIINIVEFRDENF